MGKAQIISTQMGKPRTEYFAGEHHSLKKYGNFIDIPADVPVETRRHRCEARNRQDGEVKNETQHKLKTTTRTALLEHSPVVYNQQKS